MTRAMTLGVTRAEVQAVRTFVVRAVCLKMPKAVALKIGFLIAKVVRLQQSKSKLAVQGSSCADLVYQLGSSQCLLCFVGEEGWRWIWNGLPWEDRDFPEFSEVMINIDNQLRHSQHDEYDSEVFLDLVMDGPDHRDMAGDALFGGSKGKEDSQTLVLEVGPVESPEWGVDIKVIVEKNGKAGVMEVSGYIMEFFWEGRVYMEAVCIQENIHWHDGASGSGGGDNKRGRRSSIN